MSESEESPHASLVEEVARLRRRVGQYERELAAARDLARNAQLFRAFVDHGDEGFGWSDLDGVLHYVNPTGLRILGVHTSEEAIERPVTDFYPPAERRRIREEVFPTVLRTGSWSGELEVLTPDRRRVPTSNKLVLLRNADDAPFRVANVFSDLTERRHTHDERRRFSDHLEEQVERRTEEVRASEEHLSATLDSIGDAVVVVGRGGGIRRMNRGAESMTGRPGADALGLPLAEVFELLDADSREPLGDPLARILREGRLAELADAAILLGGDGTERRVAGRGAPIRGRDGKAVGVVLVLRDVTEEFHLQERLRQSQKMEAIGQLAGGIAHDFNNLLTSIIGNAEMLAAGMINDGEEAFFTGEILQAAERSAELIDQLLAFSRKYRLQTRPVDLHETIHSVMRLLQHSVDKRIEVHTELEADAAMVIGDPSGLQSALLNLGLNARDALPGGGTITFRTRATTLDKEFCEACAEAVEPGDYVEVIVTDTGCGMPLDVQQRMFEPFFTTKGSGLGTGLGLATVFGCVKAHRGLVRVYSREGEGTLIRILLPVGSADSEMARVWEIPASVRGRGRILVVDDEEHVLRFVSRALRRLGYEVSVASDGPEAVEYFREHALAVDLVILDLIMPRFGGEEVLARMLEIRRDARILISSGFSQEATRERLLEQGAVGFLAKPYRISELSREVAQLIGTGVL